jgi:hypothetical protein
MSDPTLDKLEGSKERVWYATRPAADWIGGLAGPGIGAFVCRVVIGLTGYGLAFGEWRFGDEFHCPVARSIV